MYKLIATCPDETKHILARELEDLGCTEITELYRAVSFTATEEQFYTCHLKLRTASNLILVIKEDIAAKTEIMLKSQARRIKWETYFDSKQTYLVDANQTDRGQEFMTSNELSKAVRIGIEERFSFLKEDRPTVDLQDPDVKVVVFSRNQRVMLGINTTKKTMHKRGYKSEDHPAPLKETLAASVLLMAGYNGSQALLDPMCGSGTIAIEAAMIALSKAPLIHRKKDEFGFEFLKIFNRDMWRDIQQNLREEKEEELAAPIFASDINKSFVDMSQRHALKARVEKYIDFSVQDFFKMEKPCEKGLLVMNLPYGERLKKDVEDDEKMMAFYKSLGDHLKKSFGGWRAAILVSEDSPYKFIGLKTTKKNTILNGSIPCKLLIFDMFAGKHSEFVKEKKSVIRAIY